MFTPSILLSETHFPHLAVEGIFPAAIERIAEQGFFRNVELTAIEDPTDRRRIGEMVRAEGLSVSYWLTLLSHVENLNLSSADEALRKKSTARLTGLMDHAAECGATRLGLASGPDPGVGMRVVAMEQLHQSLCELCQAAGRFPDMQVMIEPLDRGAHKNGLLGPTSEFVPFIRRVRKHYANVGICWDSAHVALCGEDVGESLTAAADLVSQMHLSNAVLDRSRPGFGDHHMPMGSPGFLTVDVIAELLAIGVEVGLLGQSGPCIAVEVRTLEAGDPWANVEQCAAALQQAWRCAMDQRNMR